MLLTEARSSDFGTPGEEEEPQLIPPMGHTLIPIHRVLWILTFQLKGPLLCHSLWSPSKLLNHFMGERILHHTLGLCSRCKYSTWLAQCPQALSSYLLDE